MHIAILIKVLLEIIYLFDFINATRGSNDCVFLDESRNNTQCFQLNALSASVSYWSFGETYKATSNVAELVFNFRNLISSQFNTREKI